MTPGEKSRIIKALGREAGFDRVGVAPAGPSRQAEYYRDWLAAGYAGRMGFLSRNVEVREDSRLLLDGARSVICVALNYRRADAPAVNGLSERPNRGGEQESGAAPPLGRVAQYARGRDYHQVMLRMLRGLVSRLRTKIAEPFRTRICIDSAPLMERELGRVAGLGWVGKNTLLLHHELGSFFFLGEVLTTLELEYDEALPDHCGSCTRCLDACPTQAFIAPYRLDATRCISYLTIENHGEIPAELAAGVGDWVFGCDVCQDVCPFNARAPLGTQPEIMQERIGPRVDLRVLARMTSGDHRRMTKNSATGRASRRVWLRNARIALRNAGREAQ